MSLIDQYQHCSEQQEDQHYYSKHQTCEQKRGSLEMQLVIQEHQNQAKLYNETAVFLWILDSTKAKYTKSKNQSRSQVRNV